jgi:hypothetical protein
VVGQGRDQNDTEDDERKTGHGESL